MIDQILPCIYRIEIPLPNNPLKATILAESAWIKEICWWVHRL
jgi:hypothetical protein